MADILKNPRLKTTREFYGSPDDNRFALVNSDTWTMPDDFKLDIPGMRLTPAGQKGKRLLGIRIDQYHEGEKENANTVIVVTLVNAGGSAERCGDRWGVDSVSSEAGGERIGCRVGGASESVGLPCPILPKAVTGVLEQS